MCVVDVRLHRRGKREKQSGRAADVLPPVDRFMKISGKCIQERDIFLARFGNPSWMLVEQLMHIRAKSDEKAKWMITASAPTGVEGTFRAYPSQLWHSLTSELVHCP